ncbi:Arm DNA-binding domain-containing protein [Mucilaginibacter sp. RB4R14]|uniref:Arm DNA-binding domain-containing protein n=1 Tax=Mucilaginibacter aurantiaciroseus TaxID=2949308 RepID=UPI0020908DE9|nr:Arm DNA-binding domain-containing protein [Mucilaginibacter aurantiaciroseus]MCO5936367.1 Arm DNA-binding domain-containing protein [Mucilaginibacter aurantiaciroseus]
MKSTQFNQSVSYNVLCYTKPNADGKNLIFMRVIIDRKKKDIGLNIYWPAENFDNEKQIAKPRHFKDIAVEAVNMVLNEAKARASRIKLRYFTETRLLSISLFKKEFEQFESRENFLFYWEEKIIQVLKDGVIIEYTAVRHRTNLIRFKLFPVLTLSLPCLTSIAV